MSGLKDFLIASSLISPRKCAECAVAVGYSFTISLPTEAFAIFPILIYCYVLKKKITLTNGSLIPGIIAGILFAIEFIFLFTALDYSTVTRVSLIFYTMPVWLTLAAHFLIIAMDLIIEIFTNIFPISKNLLDL